MKHLGKRGLMRVKARKLIAEYCERIGLNWCENPECKGNRMGLAPAHFSKRIEYKTAEQLANPNEWICLCGTCHAEIEGNRDKTKRLFDKLRPNR